MHGYTSKVNNGNNHQNRFSNTRSRKDLEVKPTEEFIINHPNLITLPIIHKTDTEKRENVPYLLINLANDDEHILKGEEIAIMEELMVNSDQIQKEGNNQETKEQLKSGLKVRKE